MKATNHPGFVNVEIDPPTPEMLKTLTELSQSLLQDVQIFDDNATADIDSITSGDVARVRSDPDGNPAGNPAGDEVRNLRFNFFFRFVSHLTRLPMHACMTFCSTRTALLL
jgi:hypothetical protein